MQIDFGKIPKWTAKLFFAAMMAANTAMWAYSGHSLIAVFHFALTLLAAGQTVGDYRSRRKA